MSTRVFKLGGVPSEEADGVRNALLEASISFYETPPSPPGVSRGGPGMDPEGIWVADEDVNSARAVIDSFQMNWRVRHTGEPGSFFRTSRTSRFPITLLIPGLVILFCYLLFPA